MLQKKYIYDEFYIAGNNKMYLSLKVKCLIFLPNFNQIWSFSTEAPVYNYMKICPMGAAMIHSDRSTERRQAGQANRRFLHLCVGT